MTVLYYADGQIRDEVYVYGSFLQSAMYRAGVTCSDCHNPHSLALHTGNAPNDVCGAVPCASDIRDADRAFRARAGIGRLRRLPYAGNDVHGRRPSARPQFSRPDGPT